MATGIRLDDKYADWRVTPAVLCGFQWSSYVVVTWRCSQYGPPGHLQCIWYVWLSVCLYYITCSYRSPNLLSTFKHIAKKADRTAYDVRYSCRTETADLTLGCMHLYGNADRKSTITMESTDEVTPTLFTSHALWPALQGRPCTRWLTKGANEWLQRRINLAEKYVLINLNY